jgi:thiol-disulfide isomerase/thioredoxin
MKKKLEYLLGIWIALFVLAGCGKQAAENDGQENAKAEAAEIHFKLSNAPSGQAKVIGTIGSTNYLVDSIMPSQGEYLLKRDSAIPPGLYFLVLPNDVVFQFLLDKDQTFTLEANVANPLATAKVDGSLDNMLLYQNLLWEEGFQQRFQSMNNQLMALAADDPNRPNLQAQFDALVAERKAHVQTYRDKHPESFFTQFKMAGQNPDLRDIRKPDGSLDEQAQIFHYRNEYWDNTPLEDKRLLATPVIFNKLKTYITQITPQQHDSIVKYADIIIAKTRQDRELFKFVVNWIAIEYHEPKQMGLESVFVYIVDKYFTDQDAFWADQKELADIRREVNEMRPSLIGKIGQDLVCTNVRGQKESLYSLTSPATILYIWNYECEHCQERTPVLKTVAEQYRQKGLQVFALCTGNDEKEWKAFIQKYGIQSFHNVWDPKYESEFYKKYHVDVTPELYVLDGNHKIIAKDLHPNQLEPILNPMFQQ